MKLDNYLGTRLAVLFVVFLMACQTQNFKQGEKLYEQHCQSCHQEDGKGLAKLYPPLNNADFWKENIEEVPCIIRHGLKDTILVNGVQYNSSMAGIPSLTDYEISNIINYIQHAWYEPSGGVKFKNVENNLKNCQ